MDIRSLVVNDGTVSRSRVLGHSQHEADTAAIEEGHIGGFEQERQSEHVPVKRQGSRNVFDGQCDLSDGCNGGAWFGSRAHAGEYNGLFPGFWKHLFEFLQRVSFRTRADDDAAGRQRVLVVVFVQELQPFRVEERRAGSGALQE